MWITKNFIFHYDKSQPCWTNHTKLLEHDGMHCSATFIVDEEDDGVGVLDFMPITFKDGFAANAYVYELEEVE
jgi:hypothetical protein